MLCNRNVFRETNAIYIGKPLFKTLIWSHFEACKWKKFHLLSVAYISYLIILVWTLNAEMEKRISAFQVNCMRRILQIHYSSHTSNKEVWQLMVSYIGEQERLISVVKRRKLQWFGHVVRWKHSLANTILQGGTDGRIKRGRPVICWIDNIKQWTGMDFKHLIHTAEDIEEWKTCVQILTLIV